jgi:hypothetical protein
MCVWKRKKGENEREKEEKQRKRNGKKDIKWMNQVEDK